MPVTTTNSSNTVAIDTFGAYSLRGSDKIEHDELNGVWLVHLLLEKERMDQEYLRRHPLEVATRYGFLPKNSRPVYRLF